MIKRAVVSVLLLLVSSLTLAQTLSLSLASQPPQEGLISTQSLGGLTLNVNSGQSVSFARQSGRDYRLQASGGFFWTQVQEVPRDAEMVVLTPTIMDDDSIEVAVQVRRKADTREQSFSSTLTAPPGEWVQLYGPAPANLGAAGTVQVYGTQQRAQDTLYLRVDPQ